MKLASVAALPTVEIAAYFVIWIGGVFYSVYHVYVTSERFGKELGVEELEPGWSLVGRRKDVSDYEWRMWLPFLWELAPWLFVHLAVAEMIRSFKNTELLRLWYVIISSLFMVHYCGWIVWVVMVIVPVTLFAIACTGISILCWAASIVYILSLGTINSPMLSEKQEMALYVCFAWVQLRSISFCIDWINLKPWSIQTVSKDDHSPQILRFLSYIFYLPLMYLGPFVPFVDFENGFEAGTSQSLKSRMSKFALNLVRFLGWMAITEFCLHFIYCNAFQQHHEALPFLDVWTLNGLAYCIGQFFCNKYVFIYGLSGTFAEFDGISAPPIPRCIAHIALYSDMWRHFDRGFYNFLRSYIYDPLVEKYSEKKQHVLLTTVCFTFVYIWHGLNMNVFIWSLCNFLGILLETFGRRATTLEFYQQFEGRLTPQNTRRWRALASSPLFILSALSMFFFLGNLEVGTVFVSQVLHGSFIRNMTLLFFAYCMCQVSLEIKVFKERRKNVKVN